MAKLHNLHHVGVERCSRCCIGLARFLTSVHGVQASDVDALIASSDSEAPVAPKAAPRELESAGGRRHGGHAAAAAAAGDDADSEDAAAAPHAPADGRGRYAAAAAAAPGC